MKYVLKRMNWLLKGLLNRVKYRKEIDVMIKEAHYRGGKFEVTLEHPGFAMLAQEIGQMLRDYEAPNYLETRMFDPVTMRQYSITVQDRTRPTPAEVARILRRALEDIALLEEPFHPRDYAKFARQTAALALEEVGYLKPHAGEREQRS
jgi:hypothetical protein